eukprot:GHVO01051848.1.p1 GENE.GHVO01051848.1~~GHVO01051848.1.p1  ORF type:complete len:129 (+),score=12.35 GHVO01051848.1:623-1009(+)
MDILEQMAPEERSELFERHTAHLRRSAIPTLVSDNSARLITFALKFSDTPGRTVEPVESTQVQAVARPMVDPELAPVGTFKGERGSCMSMSDAFAKIDKEARMADVSTNCAPNVHAPDGPRGSYRIVG